MQYFLGTAQFMYAILTRTEAGAECAQVAQRATVAQQVVRLIDSNSVGACHRDRSRHAILNIPLINSSILICSHPCRGNTCACLKSVHHVPSGHRSGRSQSKLETSAISIRKFAPGVKGCVVC